MFSPDRNGPPNKSRVSPRAGARESTSRFNVYVATLSVLVVLPCAAFAQTATSFVYPVGDGTTIPNVTQGYTVNGHTGVDLTGGDEIRATAAGRVVRVLSDPSGWGNMVRIEHQLPSGDIVYSQYGHMKDDSLLVAETDPPTEVAAGQQIGTIGNTGNVSGATGIHLHFEIKKIDRNGCGYIPSENCAGTPCDNWDNYYDPLQFVADHLSSLVIAPNGDIYYLQNQRRYHVLTEALGREMESAGMPGWVWNGMRSVGDAELGEYAEGPDFITTGAGSNGLLARDTSSKSSVRFAEWCSTLDSIRRCCQVVRDELVARRHRRPGFRARHIRPLNGQ